MQTATGTAVAGGVIVAALIDVLVSKELLAPGDVGTILHSALSRLPPFGQTPDIQAARETISGIAAMYAPKGDR